MTFEGYSKLNCPDLDDVVNVIFHDENNILVIKLFDNEDKLQQEWSDIQIAIAGSLQSKLNELGLNQELAWNIYIIYLVNFQISMHLENIIESDKYCCKKYLVKVPEFDFETIKNEIIKQIPLFAKFEVNGTQSAASSDTIIKAKIFQQSNQSPLARKFLEKQNIEQILDPSDINLFLDSLEQEEQ